MTADQYLIYQQGMPHAPLAATDPTTRYAVLQWHGEIPVSAQVIHADHNRRLAKLLVLVADLRDDEANPLKLSLLQAILAEMAWQADSGRSDQDVVDRICQLFRRAPGMAHSLAGLSQRFDIARSTLQRRFKAQVGVSPMAFLQRVRAEAAVRLLAEGQASAAVAEAVGVATVPALSRLLRTVTGQTIRDARSTGQR